MCCFFFNDTATTEIYTLSLHDRSSDLSTMSRGTITQGVKGLVKGAVSDVRTYSVLGSTGVPSSYIFPGTIATTSAGMARSEEHTSELQSRQYLVCRLLLEKKNKKKENV